MRNRTLEGEAGLEVLWALRPDAGGPDVVVDRGWVRRRRDEGASVLPDGATGARPAPVR